MNALAPTVSRRSALGALAVVTAMASTAHADPDASSPWQMAMRRFEQARAAETAFDIRVWMPAYEACEMDECPIPDDVDAELTRLTDLRCLAEDALIATAAPNLPAAIWKIEYARDRWADCDDWPQSWWQHVMMDLTRLAASMGGC